MAYFRLHNIRKGSVLLLTALLVLMGSPSPSLGANLCAQSLAPSQGQLANERLLSFGNSSQLKPEIQGPGLSVVVWNIHKAEDSKMYPDFARMAEGIDLALFQEAVSSEEFESSIQNSNSSLRWSLAKSWQRFDKTYTGVATGTRIQPLQEKVLVSEDHEPLSNTPKTILLSEFRISGRSETLLVANIHAINFTLNGPFERQIEQLAKALQNHEGPLLVAGDFNTWSSSRKKILFSKMQELGLVKVTKHSSGIFDLDHIFIRGLKVMYQHDYSWVKSSDHQPMAIDFLFEN